MKTKTKHSAFLKTKKTPVRFDHTQTPLYINNPDFKYKPNEMAQIEEYSNSGDC